MEYIALYRRWRPTTFDDLVGQEHISRTISQAIRTGKIGHAYLFSGPRGTGKTSTAKILAKALNCAQGPTPSPCNECLNCRKITEGSSMDVFEIDAASNRGIDEIRDLRETVKFAPVDGRYKVYIIDEVHMLTQEAFNALLKTLEEPPPHVVFVLATTEAHKVPATIQSRCQRYDFKRITVEEIAGRLAYVAKESGIDAEPEALTLIAIHADGGLRDALSVLDQCAALSDGRISKAHVQELLGLVGHDWIFRLAKAIARHDTQEVLAVVADLLRDGKELRQLLAELALHLRSIMIYQAAGSLGNMDLYAEPEDILAEQAKLFPQEAVPAMLRRLHEGMNELRWSPQPRIAAEVALLALARRPEAAAQPGAAGAKDDTANARIAQLEARLAQLAASMAQRGGAPPSPVAAAPVAPAAPAAKPIPARQPSQPMPAVRAVPPAAAPSPELSAIWQQLQQTLLAQGKRLAQACIAQGTPTGLSDTQCFVTFPSHILAQLAMRTYRQHVEPILSSIVGRDLALVCASAAEAPAPPPMPQKPERETEPKKAVLPAGETPVQVDLDALEPEERRRVEQAMEVFGNTFVKPHDE